MNTVVLPIAGEPRNLQARIDHLEENRRYVQNVLEMVLSLVDFQENILNSFGPENIMEEAEKRIRHIIPFESNALFLVNHENSDFQLAVCNPPEAREAVAREIEDAIEKGFLAWALRERRGITIASHNQAKRLVLHVIATHSRIRGIFIGILDNARQQIPDTSLTLLSIILLNTANAMESLEFYRLMRHQNAILEKKVEERTQALAESERQMQQALKIQAIGTLAGGIAHDFNNILFPIIGYTELTIDDVAEDSQARKNLEEILKAANRAKELVQQILTFSRQNGRERKPIKVQVITSEALKLLRASIPKTIDITSAMGEGCKAILGDPTQIHQVIMNLCTNAYQAMQENGGVMEVGLDELDIGYEEMIKRIGIKMGRHVHLWVKDNGVGMDAAVMERIFEPYYTTKEPGKGTGLGLSVIHGIVKNHGGFIKVESTPGMGSTFHVYLPTLEESVEESKKQACAPETSGKGHILLVDDEETIVAMARQMLEKFGYEVTAFTSSSEALEAFKREPSRFDLLITDMTMPQMTGDQLAKQLMDIEPTLPVILCTGYNEMITEDKALKLGIKKFVMKPIVRDDFAAAIRSVIGTKRPTPLPPANKPL